MASHACSRCGERIRGKAGSLYVSWYPDRDHRVSYLVKLDAGCCADVLVPLLTRPTEDLSLCPQCGGNLDADTSKTFITVYVPHKEQYDDDFETCEGCAGFFRDRLKAGGELQPDRGVEVRGPSPSSHAWAAIPI